MRAAIYCDIPGTVARALIGAVLAEADRRSDFTVVAFVTANDRVLRPISTRVRLRRISHRALMAATKGRLGGPTRFDIVKTFARHDVPTYVADASVNDQVFLDKLIRETNPDLLLSIDGLQILEQSTLDRFADAVNYHDGLLPKRAGRAATSQSMYLGDQTTGFTFHRMTSRLDTGPVLLQASVSTEGNVIRVLRRKIEAAADSFGEVLDAIARGDEGEVQQGERNYHSVSDRRNLTVIEEPSALTREELLQRDRAFVWLSMPIGTSREKVTSLKPSKATAPYAFPTSDGYWLRPSSINYLPTRLIFAARRVRDALVSSSV